VARSSRSGGIATDVRKPRKALKRAVEISERRNRRIARKDALPALLPRCRRKKTTSRPSESSRIDPSLRQVINCPPFAESVDPVMKPASSAARKTTQRAISSGSPSLLMGIWGKIDFSSTSFGTALTISVAI
jgi:hypothetical protein